MLEKTLYIAVIEPSRIISTGLRAILSKTKTGNKIFDFASLADFLKIPDFQKFEIIILNPNLQLSEKTAYSKLFSNRENISILGLVYQFFEKKNLSGFDEIIQISDSEDEINKLIENFIKPKTKSISKPGREQLTERERDVLIRLANGLSNKEIADFLNISIHTVISHRKNITEKTGIKSQSGLTIYAISNKIIDLENFPI